MAEKKYKFNDIAIPKCKVIVKYNQIILVFLKLIKTGYINSIIMVNQPMSIKKMGNLPKLVKSILKSLEKFGK